MTAAGGIDWHAPADAARAEALRLELERETTTLRGFRRRVRTTREWSILGAIIGVPVLVFALVDPVLSLATTPAATVWEWFAASGRPWWTVLGIALIGATVISSAVRIRREFALFTRGGWIAFSASTGLVQLNSDGPSSIEYDHRTVGGQAQYPERKFGDPLMLLSGAHMPVTSFIAAVDAVRAGAVRRRVGDASLVTLTRQTSLLRAVPADPFFSDAAGCVLGVTRDAPFAIAIPRPMRDGRVRIRLARVRLDARQALVSG